MSDEIVLKIMKAVSDFFLTRASARYINGKISKECYEFIKNDVVEIADIISELE